MSILIKDNSKIELFNVALAPKCDSNLIFFGQLYETGITFDNNYTAMLLMKDGKLLLRLKKIETSSHMNLHNQEKLLQLSKLLA